MPFQSKVDTEPQIQKQGEDYSEVDVTEEEPVSKPKAKVNAKVVAIALVAVLLIAAIIVVVVFMTIRGKAKEDERAMQEQLEFDRVMSELYAEQGLTMGSPEVESVEVPEVMLIYSGNEVYALRKWGYTAREIEKASNDRLSAQALVDEARAMREEAQKEALAAVSDTASPEYQNLLASTWLGGEDIDLSTVSPDALQNATTSTENVDFEKVEPKGTQLFVRLYLKDGTKAFMDMTPRRYVQLNDSGNMVVTISRITIGDVTVITNIEEVIVEQ